MAKSYRLHYAWIVLSIGTLVVFGSLGLARFGYSMVLPAMQGGLTLDDTGAGLIASANLAGYLALSVVAGALATRFGPRLVASLGMGLVGLGMIFTGTSNSLLSAMFWRGITGLGSGASNVPTMALMSAWFSPRLRGFASGIAVAGSSIGLIVLGPLVPRMLAARPADGWRVSWSVFAACAFLLALAAGLLLRNHPSEKGVSSLGEKPGAEAASRSDAGSIRWGMVYRSATVWHLGLVYSAFGFSYIIYMTFFVRYLVGEIGLANAAAGNLFMTLGWFSLACGLIWGSLSDRIGRRLALVIVFLIHALAFGLFVIWPSTPGLQLSVILYGLTAWSIPAIMAATCGDVLGPRLAPAALGFITLLLGFGQAVGPSVAGAVADASQSLKGAFLLSSFVAILGAVGAWMLKPTEVMSED